ncbi:hypothetical protein [Thalassobacillus hwangdonensis]|uniref:Uncharacterized protein n=1 Tax=Thalassobacillus hwangdonensis TaxID=546108 RepID=A0ABW3KY08_9BACI
MKRNHDYHPMYDQAVQHMHLPVVLSLADGQQLEGVVVHVDGEFVYIDVPESQSQDTRDASRQYGYGPYGYPGYGYPGYGYPPYGGYGARRLILPLAALVAISALGAAWY